MNWPEEQLVKKLATALREDFLKVKAAAEGGPKGPQRELLA